MSIICLPQEQADKFKKALKDKGLDLANLYDMNSKELYDEFYRILPSEELARFVTAEFEKAKSSDREDALERFVKKTTSTQKIKEYGLLDKIKELKEKGGLMDNKKVDDFLEYAISQKLGINLKGEEILEIKKLTDNLDKAIKENENADYFTKTNAELKQINKINRYLYSRTPAKNIKILLSTIRRGWGMLASFKSPILNITSNTYWGTLGAVERRVKYLGIKGYNFKESVKLAIKSIKIYKNTGYDITRMLSISDEISIRGEKIVHSEGRGFFRAWGRMVEKYIFNPFYQAPDVLAANFAFSDVVRLASTRVAKYMGLKGQEAKNKALELMTEAYEVDMNNISDEAKAIRIAGMTNAFYYTYTNNSKWAELGLGARELVNKMGDVGLGDALIPFIKTPSNVMGAGVELSGVGGYTAIKKSIQGFKKMKSGIGSGKEEFDQAISYAVRFGLGMVVAFLVAEMIDDEDYYPDYFTATSDEREFAKQNNIPFNSVKVGNRWVSFEYFGPLVAPIKGILHARKYGKGAMDKFINYGKGMAIQLISFPGLSDLAEILDTAKKSLASEGDPNYIKNQFANGVVNFVYTTFIPAIVSDLAVATDEYARKSDTPVEKIIAKLPFLRKELNIKTNTFGDKIKTEGFLLSVFSGARIKTPIDGDIFNELQRLLDTGYFPAIKDVEKTSQKVKLLKEKIGKEKFDKMINEFGNKFKKELDQEIDKKSYKKLTDEEKKLRIEEIKNEILTDVVEKYGYKKYKKQAEKQK